MARNKYREFSEQVVVRLTPEQRSYVDEMASLMDVKPSAFVRALINHAEFLTRGAELIDFAEQMQEEVSHVQETARR